MTPEQKAAGAGREPAEKRMSLEAALAEAANRLAAGNAQGALAIHQQILAQRPGALEALLGAARALAALKRWEEALGFWRQVLAAEQRQDEAASGAALALYALGDVAGAEAAFSAGHGATPELQSQAGLAFFYVGEGYQVDPRGVMGRQVANEGLLRGWLRHTQAAAAHVVTLGPSAATAVAALAAHERPGLPVGWTFGGDLAALRRVGALLYPAPDIGWLGWRRARAGANRFSLVGMTHTTSTESAMEGIADFWTAPLHPWDAVICPSHSVRQMMERVLEARAGQLASRLGSRPDPAILPQMPVIPLGIDCAAFAPRPGARELWRQRLGITGDDIAILSLGRLCHRHKANPWPLYRALSRAEAAARAAGQGGRWHLIQAGWFPDPQTEAAFDRAAQAICPSITLHKLDGRQAEVRRDIRAAGDIFVSLPDNIQETFGLTPIEAMAAGLPVIASDWDGYRESVGDGEQGFLIPTWTGSAAAGEAFANRLEAHIDPYGDYLLRTTQHVAVDIDRVTAALLQLAGDPALRARMGAAGMVRARQVYDWSVIIPQIEALTADLAALRQAAPEIPPAVSPTRLSPYDLFSHYPTHHLLPESRIEAGSALAAGNWLPALLTEPLTAPAATLVLKPVEMAALLAAVAAGEVRQVAQARGRFAAAVPEAVDRSLLWLAKMDLLRLLP